MRDRWQETYPRVKNEDEEEAREKSLEASNGLPERCQCRGIMIVEKSELEAADNEQTKTTTYMRCLECNKLQTFVRYHKTVSLHPPHEWPEHLIGPPMVTPIDWKQRVQDRMSSAIRSPVIVMVPEFAEFMTAISRRLKAGADTYGDASLIRPPNEIASEIEEELLDVCGWAFLLWLRVRRLEVGEKEVKP